MRHNRFQKNVQHIFLRNRLHRSLKRKYGRKEAGYDIK
nr:MAG TPA: hypothetical protein [Caudoviricetes sp.]